jgi:hypothetical protein
MSSTLSASSREVYFRIIFARIKNESPSLEKC